MKTSAERAGWMLAVLAIAYSGITSAAEVVAVQCTIDSFRSSYSSQPDSFVIQVDMDARTITTYFGTMPLKMSRRELRGAGRVSGGWQTNVVIERNTGRLGAGTDKIDGRKYSYTDLRGICILPPELQGAKYKPPGGS